MIKIVQESKYSDIVAEGCFFISNLIANVTKSQFKMRLLNREIIVLFISIFKDYKEFSKRLIINLLDALERYFKADNSMSSDIEDCCNED